MGEWRFVFHPPGPPKFDKRCACGKRLHSGYDVLMFRHLIRCQACGFQAVIPDQITPAGRRPGSGATGTIPRNPNVNPALVKPGHNKEMK